MKAHQRLVREKYEHEPSPVQNPRLEDAVIREIDWRSASSIILKYEWLGNMGTTEYAFGMFYGDYLAGVACFGRTAGSNVTASICGQENASRAITLCRGACVHWAHPHSASFLINKACALMTAKGFNIFVAYSDVEAGEIGTVYQASNWLYCGAGGTPTLYVNEATGKKYDSRKIGTLCRSRKGRPTGTKERAAWIEGMRAKGYRVHAGKTPWYEIMTRKQAEEVLIADGYKRIKGTAKHRYVHIAGDKRTVRTLRKALKLEVLPYPKRVAV